MDHSVEYKKICPFDGEPFTAEHLSRKYCSDTCKKRMFRKKKQLERQGKKEENNAIEYIDSQLELLFNSGKINITKVDLDKIQINPKGYYNRYQIDSFILYVFKKYALMEVLNRNYIIYKFVKS
jgi:hypothetical protein